jgi:hypothetical protein
MHARLKDLKDELEVKKGTMYRVQMVIINEKYAPILEELEKHLLNYEKLQLTGWRVEQSEVKLSGTYIKTSLHDKLSVFYNIQKLYTCYVTKISLRNPRRTGLEVHAIRCAAHANW